MRFTAVIVKNLVRRKTRTALTAAGLASAVAATIALLNMVFGYARATIEGYARRGVDIVVTRAGVADRATSNLDTAIVSRLAALPDVAAAEGCRTELASLGSLTLVGIPFQGLDPNGFAIKALTIVSGRNLTPADRHKVLLGLALAKSLEKQPHDSVEIEGKSFEVVGLFRTDEPLESAIIVGPLADVQELFERPGTVSDIEVRMKPAPAPGEDNQGAISRLCRQIEALTDPRGTSLGLKAFPTRQFVNSETTLRLATATAWGTSVLAVVLALFGVLNTMLMSVFERTRELGMLRAVGWRRRRILQMILGESLVIGGIAAVGGIMAAWCLVRSLSLWSATQAFVSGNLLPASVLCGVALAVGAGLVGSLYPAYRGASISPVEALRYE